jgi:AraC-like DNA-binding protein
MEPDLELVEIRRDESFVVWSHGYPYRTVRWHFHPEYELHFVSATNGRFFVGDHIAGFQAGQLVLIGPNLPHNWISDVPSGCTVPQRSVVVQFSPKFIADCVAVMPELGFIQDLLNEAKRGLEFSPEIARAVRPLILELLEARGGRRVGIFFQIFDVLTHGAGRSELASAGYLADATGYMSSAMNRVLAYIRENLTEDLREDDIARLSGQSPSAFSRSFRRHTGMTFVQYINRMRINLACHMLLNADLSITDICYQVGFNNMSNFNRQFLAQKNMPPSKFRAIQTAA